MEILVLNFICLLFYSVIASQSISYIISLTDVQQKMNAEEYISFRKVTDKNYRAKFGFAFYGCLLSNLLLVIRAKWLHYFRYRQIVNLTGFVCLVAGVIFS